MAITSFGYDGTLYEAGSAKLLPVIGPYGVVGPDDWKLTPHPTTAQAVNLSPGQGWGPGIYDISDSVATVQCPAITSGTRWDMITAKRDWQPVTGVTSFAAVEGATDRQLYSREDTPGVIDEQPLWLVQWTAGQTQPTQIVDLRCWSGPGGIVAGDFLSLGYLKAAGARVQVGSRAWRCGPDGSGNLGWSIDSVTSGLTMVGQYRAYGGAYASPAWTVHPSGLVTLTGSVGHSVSAVQHIYQKEYEFGSIPKWAAPSAKTPFPLAMSVGHMAQPIGYVYPDGKLTYSVATTTSTELWMSLNAVWIAQGGLT